MNMPASFQGVHPYQPLVLSHSVYVSRLYMSFKRHFVEDSQSKNLCLSVHISIYLIQSPSFCTQEMAVIYPPRNRPSSITKLNKKPEKSVRYEPKEITAEEPPESLTTLLLIHIPAKDTISVLISALILSCD